jgi:hypothetical protein
MSNKLLESHELAEAVRLSPKTQAVNVQIPVLLVYACVMSARKHSREHESWAFSDCS